MLDPGSEESLLIHSIQKHTDERVRKTALIVDELGGDDAFSDHLRANLVTLISLAVVKQGPQCACALMEEGLHLAEGYSEGSGS